MYRTELLRIRSAEPAIRSAIACQCPGLSLWPVFYCSPRFYSMHGTLRYIRGRPSSPRAAFALGGVASSHQPHKRAGSSWSRLNGSPGRTVRRSSTICVDGSGPRVPQRRRHLRTFEASRPASSRDRMRPQPAEDLPISPPGRASASSGGGPPSPWRVWAPTAGG